MDKGQKIQFAMEEFKALRAEILERSKLDYNLQRNSMLACGGVYAFVLSKVSTAPAVIYLLFLVPILLFVVFL